MTILIIGEDQNLQEARLKFGSSHSYVYSESHREARKSFSKCDTVFDFIIEEDPTQMEIYQGHNSVIAFLNTTNLSLATLCEPVTHTCTLFGFCGLPTFLNRPILETTIRQEGDRQPLQGICEKLGTQFLVVADKAGLVTPRVIGMIINEAFFAVEDGTATREDIDLAMKLGTNYPFGPFEWARKIGLKNVCDLLDAVHRDSGDERYLVCRLLADEAKAV